MPPEPTEPSEPTQPAASPTAPTPDALTRALGGPPPDPVAALPEAVRDRLAGQIEHGRAAHERAGLDAIERALRGVPLPFRSILKKALT